MSVLSEFHFLRPWAMLLMIPAVMLIIALWRTRGNRSRWQQLIAPELLKHLLDAQGQRQSRRSVLVFALALVIACVALAGPAWERQSTPVHRQANALVIALDLSPSMVAEDIKPNRLVRARLKIAELLKTREDAETALIVYGDDAHLVTPLTDDTRNIAALLSTLNPSIMPVPGSRPEAAIKRGLKMLHDSGYDSGRILLVTDEVTSTAAQEVSKALKGSNIPLYILGVGTDAGAPIPTGRGGFTRDANNNVVIARLGSQQLQQLAKKHHGRYITSTIDHQDIAYLTPPNNPLARGIDDGNTKRRMDQWLDRGPWLVLLLLPLLLLSFRRGVVVALSTALLLPVLGLHSPVLQAAQHNSFVLDKSFLTPDQRGTKALSKGDADSAAQLFNDPLWKGTAQYRAGDYQGAANSFAQHDSALAHYNRGNALALAGQLDKAIDAYQQALDADPSMEDASSNKALIEALKDQQEQQQQNQDSSEDQPQDGEDANDEHSPSSDSGEQPDADQNSQPSTDQPEQDTPADEDQSSSASSQSSQDDGSESQSSSASNRDQSDETDEAGEQELEAQGQELTPEEQEQQQEIEQWLRQIPDDPSGLLRNKFRYEYEQKRRDRQHKKLNTFGNSEQRW